MKKTTKVLLFMSMLFMISFGLMAQGVIITGDSTINQCETKTYTIGIQNNSGNPLTNIIVTARLGNLTGFSYVNGTTTIDVNGVAAFCTVAPTVSGTDLIWNIDTQCGGPLTLNNLDTLNVTFNLQTDCNAVSGSLNVRLDYQISGTPMFDETGAHSIQVLPGGITIKKTPNVIPQELWQNVTWTLTIENTGFGTIKNVVVTDEMGVGLAYVSSIPVGVNSGQTTAWGAAEIPGFSSMNPGEKITIDITAQVIACENLENKADARWGCDLITDCYNTATTLPPSTATASVQRIVKTPLLQYTPPDVSFNYCEDYVDESFTITNIGDGRAHDVWIRVDFGSLTVSDVSAGATYNTVDKRFELTDPLLGAPGPGNTYVLSFRLNYNSWCGGSIPIGVLLWQKLYKDDCDNPFYPPVELSAINPPANSSSLTVGKTGAPATVQIGAQVTYTITSAYSGPLSCGTGSAGDVTVVDTLPNGFTVVDAGGGTWVPGGGGTGGTITWTYTPPAALSTSITLQVPDRTQCETYCFQTFTNTVQATVVDCCGCTLTATGSQTTAIECEEYVDSNKTANPVTQERCGTIQYTNTYDFGSAGILLNTLTFREYAENQQQYVPGSLTVTYDGADITACVLVTDTTPGGNLSLDFSGCAADMVNNKNLTIVYRLTITEATVSACTGITFYSWSGLQMGTIGSECLQDGEILETTPVTVEAPAMALNITGLGQIIDKCQSQTITMTLTQTSGTANPRDVRLVLSGLNYYVVNPAATICSGDVAPTSCTPTLVGDDYVWYFADGFNGSGQRAVIQLTVQKRCTGGGDLVANAYFDDNCNDDANYDDSCNVSATESPALLLNGDLLIEKNPEVFYASTNTVEWKIYVTNRGNGSAHNVWIDDILGAGLDYQSAVVNNMTGVTVTADQDHTGGVINGCTITITEMTAGQRREVTFRAILLNCSNLTNNVSTSWGCEGVNCQAAVSDSSTVEIPRPLLINTNVVTTPADACSSPSGMITLKNAGQTTCYNLQVTETLPAGLLYVSGSTRWRVNGGGWNGPNAAYDPNPTISPLKWTSTEISGLANSDPGDIIEIDYDLSAACPFLGGDITVATSYENPCGQVFDTADSVFTVAFRQPQITVTKTHTNEPIDCGELIEWTITVQNTSGYTLPIIWVEDTMDAAFTYSSSVGDPTYTSDNGTVNGQVVTWEVMNIPHNGTATLTLRATTDTSPCSPNLDNTVLAWWGCGAADGSSATKPGVDPPDNTLCLTTSSTSTVRTETREPSVSFMDIALNPTSIDSCDDSTELTVTIQNTGPTDASNLDLVITLPTGITYVTNTSAVTCGGALTDPAPEPVVSGNQLIYYNVSSTASNLCNLVQASGGNDTVTLVFSVRSNCYVTANVGFRLYYYDCCGDTQYDTTTSETLTSLYPALSITKTPQNSQVDCGTNQTWTITVTNNGVGNAQVVRIEDTLGDWIDYVSSAPAATSIGGQTYGWEINNLAAGASQSFDITGQFNPDAPQADCAAALRQNNARAIWGCGIAGDAADNDPTTTGYDCTYSAWANATAANLAMPDLVATDITPAISCTSDGVFNGTISVTVRNQGDGIASGGFQVSMDDGNGWTGTGSYGSSLAAGAETTISIDVTTWNPDCSPCTYNFSATVDSGSAVCECREDNNTFGPQAYSPAIPNLQVDNDTLAISCVADGQYRISGTVTLRNAGCAGTLTQDAAMRFTLLSGAGCTGSQVAQWTQTFTGVNIAAGATQTFTITNYDIAGNACTSASACQFSIRSEADYTNTICECDGTDNTRCSGKTFTLPDLRVVSDTLAISCNVDGGIRIQGNLVVANDGCGANFVTNIPIRIRVYNNNGACAGTNGILIFNQAGVNIPAGGTQTFAINRTLNRNLCTNSTGCQVAIGVELDYTNAICECSNANNSYCSPNKTVSIPDLQVTGDTLSVTCLQDGQVRVSGTATIANTGCNAAVAGNLPVRFTLFSNTGCAGTQLAQWTETFAGVNIAAGGSQVLTITNRDIITNICTNSTGCQVSLRIEADPAPSTICECNGGNNTRCSNKTVSVPDLRITAVTPSITCISDGSLTGTVQVTVNNNGCGAANNIPVRLTSDCGYTFTDQTVAALAAGASTTLTYSFTPDIAACTCTFTAAVDPDNVICECDGTNNSLAAAAYTSPVSDLVVSDIDFSNITCANDNISGSVSVTVNNQGCGTANNFQVSLDTDGCLSFSNQGVVSLAAGASTTLTFNIGGSWADCTVAACQFTATVDPTSAVCEYDGTNNTRTETYNSTLPDLVVNDIDFSNIACGNDNISGNVVVTIYNRGVGNAANFQVALATDGCLTFTNQTVANLAAGATTTVTFNVSGSWADCTDCDCLFTVTVDATNTVCECDGTNNTRSETYTSTLPDLRVNSVTPTSTCTNDSNFQGTVTVNVSNTGCGAANNAVVRLTSSCGYVFADQTMNLAMGANANVIFTYTPTCSNCSCTFTAVIDPDNSICECNGGNNSLTSGAFNLNVPDVTVDADTLAVACAADGQVIVSGQVTLGNQGCGSNLIADVPVRITLYDNTGCSGNQLDQWTQTFSGVNIAAGGGSQSFAITNRTITSNLVTNSTNCHVSLRVEADYNDSICECDGTNNSYCTADKNVDIPDLHATADTLGVACASDGQVTISGTVTMANDGCGSNLNANIPVRFTLFDNTGCSGNQLLQWTQTFNGVNIPAGGGTQAFTMTPQNLTSNLVTNSTNCRVSIRVEVDYTNSICESDNSNNTYCADNKAVDIPDIEVPSDALTVACTADGQVMVSGAVTLANNGCGSNLTTNVPVRLTLYDNTNCSGNQIAQWTETLSGVNIAAGGDTQVLAITPYNITSNLCANSTGCQVSLRIEADYTASICESDGTDNERCSNKTIAIPELTVNSVTPTSTCSNDSSFQGTVTVNVGNTGCTVANNAVVRLTSSCGYVFTDQTVNLAAGANTDMVFTYTPTCSNCSCTFTAVIDPDDSICECNGANNSLTSTAFALDVPDVTVEADTLGVTCADDGQVTVSGTVTLGNYGCGSNLTTNVPVRFTLYDNTACGGSVISQWTETLSGVNIAPGGGTQTIGISAHNIISNLVTNSTNCRVSLRVEADYNDSICECNGTNNDYCTGDKDVDIPDIQVGGDALAVSCTGDGQVTVSGTVTVTNSGCGSNLNASIPVRFTLYDNTGCSGNTLSQWTETLSGVNIAAGGGTQVFTIIGHSVTTNLVTNSNNCNVSLLVEADYTDSICEADGNNNTRCADNKPVDIPDIVVQSDNTVFTCTGDGQFSISGSVTLQNNGCGSNLTADIPVRFTLHNDAGCSGNQVTHWTETLTGVNIAAGGGTQTFTIAPHDVTANFCANATNCRVSLNIEADYTTVICESDGTNNTLCSDKTIAIPNLIVNTVASTIICQRDGSLTGTTVTVSNTGCGAASGVVVRLSSDCGLTFNDQVVDLAAGETREVFFNFTSGILTCTCNFTAVIDPDNAICECDGTDNTGVSTQSMQAPDLVVQGEALTVSCVGDGNIRVSGSVTLGNRGCGSNFNGSVPMRFTLFNNSGCTGTQVAQWTEIFTGARIRSAGGTQTFTITAHDIATNFCASSTNCNMSLLVEADYDGRICEWDGTNNTLCTDKTSDCLDLQAEAITAATSCQANGTIKGTFAITVRSSGGKPVTQDFSIRVDDGNGWSAEKLYHADLGGKLPLAPGESAAVTFDWTRDFTVKPYICEFNNIIAVIDSQDNICECAADNNQTTTTCLLPYPDLVVKSFLPVCSADGQRRLQMTIGNDGCGPQNNDFNIAFTDHTGQSRTVSYTSIGGVLPLGKGAAGTVTLDQWAFDCSTASTEYTITMNITGTTCDLAPASNTFHWTQPADEPDLLINSADWTCNDNGSITFNALVSNQGHGDAASVQLIVYGPDGNGIFLEQFALAKGETKQLTFATGIFPKGKDLTFRFVLDDKKSVCECNGSNNERLVTVNCPPAGGEPGLKISKNCPTGLQPGGLFKFEIQIMNTGKTDLASVMVEDFLPERFRYVAGSSTLSGQKITDPQLGNPLVWHIGDMAEGSSLTLVYTAVADADIDPGRYCNKAQASAVVKGDVKTVTSDSVQCCTVVTREPGANCCLNAQAGLMAPFHWPEGPLSFIEPYFHTESAMFTVYAALNLWKDDPLEKESMPLFIKERLQNYARSTVEEFYLGSRLGLTLPDGTLWLSYGGAYPEQDDKNKQEKRWLRHLVQETMTSSQVGFELLALNETLKIEKREDVGQKLRGIINMKLDFLASFIDDLPHGWEIIEKKKDKEKAGEGETTEPVADVRKAIKENIKKLDGKATLYDSSALYLSMVELNKNGFSAAAALEEKLGNLLKPIDNKEFDPANLREEFIFTLALLQAGQTEQAKAKVQEFEKILAAKKREETRRDLLDNLHDYALAAAVDYKAGGTLYNKIKDRMKEKYYMKDSGILADVQPDFTFKLTLQGIASLVLSFDTREPKEQEQNATILYRVFDEVGLFLKKRNLNMGNPLYSLLKNYPFSEPLLPILSFTRAKQSIAPVFSRDAVVHSTQVRPLGEILIPQTFSKILSPGYETGASRIAALSFALQYYGGALEADNERVVKEEGRSFTQTGKEYVDSLLKSGAGILSNGNTLLAFDNIAVKGPKQGEFSMEPLNSGTRFSSETLANYLLAEKLYVQGDGRYAETVRNLMAYQARIVEKFQEIGYISEKFDIYIDRETDRITLIPSREPASKITVAKFFHLFPAEKDRLFLGPQLDNAAGLIAPEDLIFLDAVPELIPYFKKEIKELVDAKDSKVSLGAADVIGRRMLKDKSDKIRESEENLARHWDRDAVFPKSDRIENIEKGLIYHHEPQQFILFLLAVQNTDDFRFKRTLNFFTYLLENEWGVENNDDRKFITLPSQEYQVFKEDPREEAEPGDILTFKVNVANACPQGFGAARDIPALYLKSLFAPPLLYAGSQVVNGLDILGDFQWRYGGLVEGAVLDYTYQAFVPYDFNYDFIDGTIYVDGRQGFQDFGPETGAGDRCQDTEAMQRLHITPYTLIQGLVYEDRNVNGVKDVGEPGIPNILIKDTRGRILRSDAEGRFTVLAGNEHEGVQVELKSIPPNFLLTENPTRLVNRHYVGEIYFGLIPCKTVTGFIYIDENGNGEYDNNEVRPSAVALSVKDKQVVTSKDGRFIFRNLPEMWQEWIKVSETQLFYKEDVKKIKIQVNK